MRKTLIAVLVAASTIASPVFAATITQDTMNTIRVHGHKMQVHAMKMDDRTLVYGLTRKQLEDMGARWYDNSRSTDGSGR